MKVSGREARGSGPDAAACAATSAVAIAPAWNTALIVTAAHDRERERGPAAPNRLLVGVGWITTAYVSAAGARRCTRSRMCVKRRAHMQECAIYYFGKSSVSTESAVNMHRALCPHNGTTIVEWWAPSFSLTYFPQAWPRRLRLAPCAIAGHEESNPASGNVSSSATRYVVGRAASCFFN